MKKVALFVAAVAMVAAFSSCKKCGTCSYTIAGISYTSPETCGDEWDQLKSAWTIYGSNGSCKEN